MLCWKGALKRPLAGVALLVTSGPETHCTDGPREGHVTPSSTSWSVLGGLNCLSWNPVYTVGGVPWTPQTEGQASAGQRMLEWTSADLGRDREQEAGPWAGDTCTSAVYWAGGDRKLGTGSWGRAAGQKLQKPPCGYCPGHSRSKARSPGVLSPGCHLIWE